MKISSLLAASIIPLGLVTPLLADTEPPAADEIMHKMKAALEPPKASVRQIDIVLTGPAGRQNQWQARQVRKPTEEGLNRMAMVMLDPPDLRGTALIVEEVEGETDRLWVWLPAVQRVRKMVPLGRFQSFLGTDFAYGDLGFVALHDRTFGDVEVEEAAEGTVFIVDEKVDEPWLYSRIETWISADTLLPLRRLYYDKADQLWKRQIFESVAEIEGVPTPIVIRMEDVQEGGSTVLRHTSVDYGIEVTDDVFDPQKLPHLIDHEIWKTGEKAEKKAEKAAGEKTD